MSGARPTEAERLAHAVLSRLVEQGVREFVICPGARNAPFISLLSGSGIACRYFYEERSAAFYALGRARRLAAPVAVITTSGTAAGELLPAAMEAHYAGVPLVFVTADRPQSYRYTGAPQTAVQPGILGVYVGESLDLQNVGPTFWQGSASLHLNVCFDEPLLSEPEARQELVLPTATPTQPAAPVGAAPDLTRFFARSKRPLAVVAGLTSAVEREGVARFLVTYGIPAYFEATSGLREDARLQHLRVHQADRVIERAARAGYAIDGVLRLGTIPTHRLWRDLEGKLAALAVTSVSSLPFSGLGRESELIRRSPALLAAAGTSAVPTTAIGAAPAATPPLEWALRFLSDDRAFQGELLALLDRHPRSEPALFRALSRTVSRDAHVYVGNSLPIRQWDLAASFDPRGIELTASRGLNGIDGQVSTFLGLAEPGCDNWAILGDLTALYDLAGPWALRESPGLRARICVVNNGGGKIFDRMFAEPEFQNRHPIRFKGWAELWGLPFEEWTEVPAATPLSGASLVELRPCDDQTRAFWIDYAKLP